MLSLEGFPGGSAQEKKSLAQSFFNHTDREGEKSEGINQTLMS